MGAEEMVRDDRDARIEDLERRLKLAERRLEETQALTRMGSWEWKLPEGQTTWSEEMLRIFDRDRVGRPMGVKALLTKVHPDDREGLAELLRVAQTRGGPVEITYRIVDEAGRIRFLHGRGRTVCDADGVPVRAYGTTQDVSEQKRSEARLERAERLEAVGQLAGGMAHDFNNLLAVILNYAEYMIAAGVDPETLEGLREVERAALTGADLTRQLLLFSRRDPSELRSVDLAAAVTDTEGMLRRTIGDHIELTVDAPAGLPEVTLGDGQAEQILVNLVVNARDALPQGGAIGVTVGEAGGDLVLAVTDDGTGMAEDVAAQAFDPFFTTKPRGKGTGLGLATVYGIAARVGGRVEIESEPGRGTTVTVYLPVATAEPSGPAGSRHERVPAPAEGRSVLVVDNEEAVRTIVSRMVARHGYRVTTAGSGAEAESVLDAPDANVDVLLTDVLMPGMTGRELVDRLRARCPSLRAIYMSGYTGDEASPLGPWDDGVAILQKPFTGEQLLQAIGDALAEG